MRYLRVGGRGLCLRAGKSPKPEKYSKMPQNPTRQVHALLAGFKENETQNLKKDNTIIQQICPFGLIYGIQ
jgi:hypothetical protein